jgi:hypothetical protein
MKTQKEQTLSDKIFGIDDWEDAPLGYLKTEDVNEFIIKLKNKFKERKWIWNEERFGERGHKHFDDFNKELLIIIDKLAGDKLI